jgi:hypothetical protein
VPENRRHGQPGVPGGVWTDIPITRTKRQQEITKFGILWAARKLNLFIFLLRPARRRVELGGKSRASDKTPAQRGWKTMVPERPTVAVRSETRGTLSGTRA